MWRKLWGNFSRLIITPTFFPDKECLWENWRLIVHRTSLHTYILYPYRLRSIFLKSQIYSTVNLSLFLVLHENQISNRTKLFIWPSKLRIEEQKKKRKMPQKEDSKSFKIILPPELSKYYEDKNKVLGSGNFAEILILWFT